MHLTMTKSEFLMNKINKQRFVNMLGETLEKNNCKSYYASADADLLIVKKAVGSATTMKTVLVGDDTDLLVLLCYHASLDTCNLLFKPEQKKCQEYLSLEYTSCVTATWGGSMQSYSIFHSILGCDTTSRLHGLGKGNALKKFREQRRFVELARVFDSQLSLKEDVIAAGEEALIIL